jgi:hypothetical protein
VGAQFDLDGWLEKQPGRAGELVRNVHQFWNTAIERRQPGFEVALYIDTASGARRVAHLIPLGPSVVLISALREDGLCDTIFAPVEQCAFTVSHFQPIKEEEKVIVGFAPPQNT